MPVLTELGVDFFPQVPSHMAPPIAILRLHLRDAQYRWLGRAEAEDRTWSGDTDRKTKMHVESNPLQRLSGSVVQKSTRRVGEDKYMGSDAASEPDIKCESVMALLTTVLAERAREPTDDREDVQRRAIPG